MRVWLWLFVYNWIIGGDLIMKTIFYVTGYSSWANKELKRAFNTIEEAKQFSIGLTDAKIFGMRDKSTTAAFNRILMSIENKGK